METSALWGGENLKGIPPKVEPVHGQHGKFNTNPNPNSNPKPNPNPEGSHLGKKLFIANRGDLSLNLSLSLTLSLNLTLTRGDPTLGRTCS